MSNVITARNVSLALGLLAAIATITSYAPSQPAMPVVGLVFLGCFLFWAWVSSLGLSLLSWLHSEVILMGRWPRIAWRPTPFKVAMLIARMVGVAAPFALNAQREGWAVLTNPERWALVPLTLGVSIGLVAIPVWLAIKIGSSKLKRIA